ncbi:MAG: exopolyphosphatase [Azoarcus sp.]|jgi:exopolyphosphatase/guanosine-5'-triphosphate,3'-diphosphate pyrophosphatase|nr:exopolyphosphatase [Azoarcus sp.]
MQDVIAAVDLGSNSFRLQVGRIVNDQIYAFDGLKEPVRLAAGLSADKWLDADAQERGIIALRQFHERLAGFPPEAVRAVATNTLRAAKNAASFLIKAEEALGFPIEIIAGREEARLIYVGVAHTLPDPQRQQLIVDIGGGSTEVIIGKSFEPLLLDSLYMGCVGYSLRYFPGGKIDKRGFREAELAARRELQTIAHDYCGTGWEVAVGSSGTARALADILEENGLAAGGITREGLERLRTAFLRAGHVEAVDLSGLRGDRSPVIPGGLAIMCAVFEEFALERMTFSEGALRLGVLYDLLGRYHQRDLRDATVEAFMARYRVNVRHAKQVADTASNLLAQLDPVAGETEHTGRRFLCWAAALHEIGISVAHASYHKHSAYILANADMPGFSRMDQERLARIVLAHRGKLERLGGIEAMGADWPLIACLRLAVVIHRARANRGVPEIALTGTKRGFLVETPPGWLQKLPLTAAAFEEERQQWQSVGRVLTVRARAASGTNGAGMPAPCAFC